MNKRIQLRYYILWVLVTVFLASFTISCSNNSDTERQLSRAENILAQNPDSAMSILESVEYVLRDNENATARYGRLNARARLMCGKTIANDKYLDGSISYYLMNKDSVALSEAYQLASIRSQHRLNQDSAIYYLQQAIAVTPRDNNTMLVKLLTETSYQLSKPSVNKNYEKALSISQQAYRYATTADDKARTLHDIGVLYSFTGKNDSCLSYIEQALELINTDSPGYTGYALNYAATPGANPIKSKQFLSAIKSESLGKHITLGFLYLNNGSLDSAYISLQRAESLYSRYPDKYSINTFNNLRLLKGCLAYGKNMPINPTDGVTTNDSISEIKNLEQRLSSERLETSRKLETDLLGQKIERQRIFMWLMALALMSVLIIFSLYYHWHKRYKRLQQEIDRYRVSQIVIEASDTPVDEAALQAIISKRLQLCLTRFRNTGYYARLQKLETEKNSEIFLPLKTRGDIQEKLLESFSEFIIDLKNDGGKLNLEDIILCLLSLLNFSAKTISRCMGASEGALRTRKSRLKGKLSATMFQRIFEKSST